MRLEKFWLLPMALLAGCGDGTGTSLETVNVRVEVSGLPVLDPATEGSYEAWVTGSNGTTESVGRIVPDETGPAVLSSPIADPVRFALTVEPPGDDDDEPSVYDLLSGQFVNGAADLDIVGSVTSVDDLEGDPGHHALFTPSNNPELSFPSIEDAGIWVFAPRPSTTKHNSRNIRLTPLREGWIYEGWIVHEYGTANACWISYGKFLPDETNFVNARDDTGLGIFSGQFDYVNALTFEVDMPGDDWVANIHDQPVPCGLELPFDLNGKRADEPPLFQEEPSPWTHVITIEPRFDRGEAPLAERPFLLQPYRNPFGSGPPNEDRVIEYHPELLPTGTVTIVR